MAAGQLTPVLRYLRKVSGANDEPSDRQLLEQFADHGDEEAFAVLVRRHGPMVLGVCRRVLHHSHDADDAFQATFLLLVRKAGRLRWPDALGPWLYGVARRTAAKVKAHAQRSLVRERPLQDVPAPTTEDLLWSDLRPVLDDAIGRLPAKYRAPFVLCYLEGMTNAQAARHLSCPPGTIATWLSRAREQLRTRLAKRGLGLPAVLTAATVPPALLTSTVQAALATHTFAASFLAAKISVLTKGVGKAMWMHKLRIGVMALIALSAVGTGVGVATYRAPAGEPQATDEPERPQAEPLNMRDAPKIEPPRARATDVEDYPTKVRTANFIVRAPTIRLAQIVADAAEHQRKKQALRWLDHELPPWKEPMPVKVTITRNESSSYTSFKFDRDQVKSTGIHLEGPLDHVLANALPHEMTHTVLAYHFRAPIPRWADEGAAMLSEDEESQSRHLRSLREIMLSTKGYPLKRLFSFREFPHNVHAFHVLSYSVTRFLVERKDRATFLAFVKDGTSESWDKAVERHYGIASVDDLETAWLEHLRGSKDKAKEEAATKRPAFGPQPFTALAVVKKDGYVHVQFRFPSTVYESKTMTVSQISDGGTSGSVYYEPVRTFQTMSVTTTEVPAYDTAGKRIDAKTLAELLKKETPVLVSADGKKVDPYHLQVVKEGTVILVPETPWSPPPAGQPSPPAVALPPASYERR